MIEDCFEFRGWFYTKNNYKLRKYLDIKRKCVTDKQKVDLMVIMMNPGSSTPLTGGDNGQREVDVNPDKVQKQIIKVMNSCCYNYARVLNLSDLRDVNSKNLNQKITNYGNPDHSIFDSTRTTDFSNLFVKNVRIIIAWGVNTSLQKLANNAIKVINSNNLVGVAKLNTNWAYYHPARKSKADWFDEVVEQLEC